jgi:hypothetical protein
MHIPTLTHAYNIHNFIHLVTELQPMEINEDRRMCSFDIENVYNNILKSDVINRINDILNTNPEIVETNQK